jgi:hypothetical protein
MKDIYDNAGLILAFLVVILVAQMFVGKKVTRRFLYLILFSQIILNPKILESLKLTPKTTEKKASDVQPELELPNYRA